MISKVYIFYNSTIIRRGIINLINDLFNVSVVECSSINQFSEDIDLSKSKHLIITDFANFNSTKIQNLIKFGALNILLIDDLAKYDLAKTSSILDIKEDEDEIYSKLKKYIGQDQKLELSSELSQREIDVLELVAKGFSNKDIAEKLFITVNTVMTHRKKITEKLGIKSISGLTIYAIMNKIIDADKLKGDLI